MKPQLNDTDIVAITAHHPHFGTLWFDRARQDGRQYYRLQYRGIGGAGGSLTDAQHARETIAYWRDKGWITV